MKSYVSMSYHVCPVCTTEVPQNEIIMDTRLRPKFDDKTCTGWGMCPTCQKLKNDGYIAIVEILNTHTPESINDWARTGNYAHLSADAFTNIFNVDLSKLPKRIACVNKDTMRYISQLATHSKN